MSSLDDVDSEVRRILSTNSIDQCIAYNQKVKKEIFAAQEELREAIGKRYRELIVACDRVVGMEDLCLSIQRAHANHQQQQQQLGKNRSSVNQAIEDQHNNNKKKDEETASAGALLDITSCRERLASIRVLLRHRHFAEAVCSYRQLVQQLATLDSSNQNNSSQGLSNVRRTQSILSASADSLVGEFKGAIIAHICDQATATGLRPQQSVVEQARDWHAAIELLHSSPPDAALNTLVEFHKEAIQRIVQEGVGAGPAKKDHSTVEAAADEQRAVESLLRIRALGIHLSWYIASLEEVGSYSAAATLAVAEVAGGGGGSRKPCMSVKDLSTLLQKEKASNNDVENNNKMIQMLTVQLCGLGIRSKPNHLQQSQGARSPAWGLSPAATTRLVPSRSVLHAVTEALLEALRELIPRVHSKPELSTLVESLLIPSNLLPRTNTQASTSLPIEERQWNEEVQNLVSSTITKSIVDLIGEVQSTLRALDKGEDDGILNRLNKKDVKTAKQQPGRLNDDPVARIMKHFAASRRNNQHANNDASKTSESNHHKSSDHNTNIVMQQCTEKLQTASALMLMGNAPLNAELVRRARRLEVFRGVQNMLIRLDAVAKKQLQKGQEEGEVVAPWFFPMVDLLTECLSESFLRVDVFPLDERERQEKIGLTHDLNKVLVQGHSFWLEEVTATFSNALQQAYGASLVPHVHGLPSTVRAVLSAQWATVQMDEARIAHPVALTPGVSQALLMVQTAVHARRTVGTLHPPLLVEVATRIVSAMQGQVRTVLTTSAPSALTADGQPTAVASDNNASINEEILLQLAFDMIVTSTAFPLASSSAKQQHENQLGELQDRCDVVSWNLVQPLMECRATEWSSGSTLSLGLLLNQVLPKTAALEGPTSSSQQQQQHPVISQSIREQLFEVEAERLPLLPITTPTQVRTVFTPAATANNGSAQTKAQAEAGGSSLWSNAMTGKLRSGVAALWGSQ